MNINSVKFINNSGDVQLPSFFSSLLHAEAQALSTAPSYWALTDHRPPRAGTRAAARAPKTQTPVHRAAMPAPFIRFLTEQGERMCGLWLC